MVKPSQNVASYGQENYIHSFVEAFKAFGFELCDNADTEEGFLKVALYSFPDTDECTHAARQLIKNASIQEKQMLIMLLSASMNNEEDVVVRQNPVEARRLNTIDDEVMQMTMQDEPTAIEATDEASLSDIVNSNKGKIAKGLERWL